MRMKGEIGNMQGHIRPIFNATIVKRFCYYAIIPTPRATWSRDFKRVRFQVIMKFHFHILK